MNDLLKVFFAMVAFALMISAVVALIFSAQYITNRPMQNACEELGFERYVPGGFGERISYCEDNEYNLHYVRFANCGVNNCEAHLISVGDVTTKQDAFRDK